MFYRATVLLVLLSVGWFCGQVLGDDTAVPATALIPDDAILVVRVDPTESADRTRFRPACRAVRPVAASVPGKPWPRRKRSRL